MGRLDKRLTLAVLAVGMAGGIVRERTAEAHKAVTSRYTYNDDVAPIVRDRCGSCHADGGATPMSLLTYKDAQPWAESIRQELMAERMPPWYVDPSGPAVTGGHAITAREIDKMITWATGGTPEGDPAKRPVAIQGGSTERGRPWRSGTPDLVLEMSAEHALAAGTTEETFEALLPTGLDTPRWVKGADLQPGTPSIVRDAVISVERGPILAVWTPDADEVTPTRGAAFRLQAGVPVRLRIHYKKTWRDERSAKSDRSRVGLYFAVAPTGGEIQAMAMSDAGGPAESPMLKADVPSASRILAVRPTLDRPYTSIDVHAVTPTGSKVPLLLLRRARPEWRRRYWLDKPVELPPGSRLEAMLVPMSGEPAAAAGSTGERLQIAIDYVGQ